MTPEELGGLVDCDLADPAFWDGGLTIVDGILDAARSAALEAGRLPQM
jgi:oligoendopeptidase F